VTAPAGSLFSTHSVRIEEVINKSMTMFLPSLDPIWRNVISTSQGVAPVDDLGRDWKVLKTFHGAVTGVIEQGGPKNDFVLYGDPADTGLGAKVHLQGLSETWPSALEGANATPFRLGIPMRSMLTNLLITMGEKQAEVTKAFIGQIIAPKMTGFGRHLAAQLCNYAYLSQNTHYSITSVTTRATDASIVAGTSNKEVKVDLTNSNHAVDRLFVGMRVQWYSSDGTTLRQAASLGTNTVFMITAIDEATGFFSFRAVDNSALDGANFLTNGFTDGDILVFANSKGTATTPFAQTPFFTGIAGLNSWLKTGDASGATATNVNSLLGAERDTGNVINVNVHPEFKSWFRSIAAPLTEHTLRKELRGFHRTKNKYGQSIDSLIASDGVWLAYAAQRIDREVIDRTNSVPDMRTGQGQATAFNETGGEMRFQMDGRTYLGYTSTYVESGTLYGLKKGGSNWKKYIPPDPRGATRGGADIPGDMPFRFAGNIIANSNELPVYITDAAGRTLLSEGSQMPGMLRMQLVPEQPAGMKLTNITEDRQYADS